MQDKDTERPSRKNKGKDSAAHGRKNAALTTGNAVVVPGDPGCCAAEALIAEAEARPVRSRILLAEDDKTSQVFMKMILTNRGFDVVIASNGREAVDRWEEGGLDLIAMDVQMPEIDGLTAIRMIREREKGSGLRIPIISLTAHAFEEDKKRCLEAGADGYLAKPVEFAELLKAIERFKS